MLFGEKILDYWDDILKDLSTVIAIPSVCGPRDGELPFGKDAARAVDAAMQMAKDYGFKTENVGYYACHAQLGEGEENAVVMAHLDVVPAGEGWLTDPYAMTIKDGFAYGRGVSDNKGPAIVALHCLRALKDAGVVGKRKLRVVFGSGEEIGMADMGHYFAKEQMPDLGFTPDSAYGICNCEKGILHFTVTDKGHHRAIVSFKAGTVVNAVPYKAEAEVLCDQPTYEILCESANKLSGDFVVTRTETGASLLSKGVASHASSPEKGVNAAARLVDLLCSVFGADAGALLQFINRSIGLSTDGSPMGIACEDAPSGKLTFNLGIVNIDSNSADFSVDIRYPATHEGEPIVDKIRGSVKAAGLCFEEYSIQNPLYLPADGPLVALLSKSYTDITGEECEIFSMGGGTYARQMGGKGVAFGASFKNSENNAHNCNECIDLEEFKLHAKICLEAMYRMFTEEL